MRARKPYLGGTAALSHSLASVKPRRQTSFRLIPVRHGGLVAPVEKMRHCFPVRSRPHEASHIVLIVPRLFEVRRAFQDAEERLKERRVKRSELDASPLAHEINQPIIAARVLGPVFS